MRVIAGQFRGRRLQAPAGDKTRPTSDRVRESLFQILGPISGANVLDLFAGSGALGIEALSRGAASATFVERDRAALNALKRNLAELKIGAPPAQPGALSVPRDVFSFLRDAQTRSGTYDLVLLDPPYRDASAISGRIEGDLRELLKPGARVVTESSRKDPLDLDLGDPDERRYGDTIIRIYRI